VRLGARRLERTSEVYSSQAMAQYRFSLMARDLRTQSNCIIDADGDDEVREIANDLITESIFHTVQVWSDSKLVYQIIRA
jgi:hypothetical protein